VCVYWCMSMRIPRRSLLGDLESRNHRLQVMRKESRELEEAMQ
jgi:hypothetical protein